MPNNTKKCPYCGEEIKAVAKKCRYCGSWLNQDTTPAVSEPNPHSFNPDENSSVGKGNKMWRYILIAVMAIAVIVAAVWLSQSDTSSSQTYSQTTESPNYDSSIYESEIVEEVVEEVIEEVVEEVVEIPDSDYINANAPTDILALKSLMSLCGKKRNEVIVYLKSQGLSPKDGGTDYNGQAIYYFELPNGTISINNEGLPHVGTGAVEFMTESKAIYSSWIEDLKNTGYSTDGDGLWVGDNAHYFTFGLYDTTDMVEEDDHAGCYTLCVKAFPMVYDESAGHYVDYEYKY